MFAKIIIFLKDLFVRRVPAMKKDEASNNYDSEQLEFNHEEKINDCENFTWGEALWLNSWKRFAVPNLETAGNIIRTAQKLELIRELLNCPLRITSWYRPDDYNIEIGGAKNSYHTKGLAVDFQPLGKNCDEARRELEPLLDRLDIRMEDKPGSNWIHIDLAKVGYERFFKP